VFKEVGLFLPLSLKKGGYLLRPNIRLWRRNKTEMSFIQRTYFLFQHLIFLGYYPYLRIWQASELLQI
jgi:hypothetical protein